MAKELIKDKLKREAVRAILERSQSIDMEKYGAPSEKNAVKYDNVQEILNIPYMNRDEVPLAMDIFKPVVKKGTELPVIVTVHGGGLTMGDRKLSRPFGRILASKGYLVFSVEYRLAPRANVCMQLDDVCAGLDLVGKRLVDYDVDFSRIFIAAESAGAYLATYVTAMKGSTKLQEAIGYEASRLNFKAIGLMSGMLYTNRNDFGGWLLAEQIYGEKRADENFLQYMNPEHPEIINNLPPVFLITSRGDFLSNYSVLMNEALKKAGKKSHLLYYGDGELGHAFSTMQTEHPKSIESIDRMLEWFEEEAKISLEQAKSAKTNANRRKKYIDDVLAGKKNNQKIWKYIKESAAVDPDRLSLPAIMDCSRNYTYGQMFEEWDKYARVFSALGITEENHSRMAIVGTISAEPIFAYYAANMVGVAASMFSYPDLLPGGRWKSMVEKEHITDMIISDIMVTPKMWQELKKAQKEFDIKHIILLHSRMGGPAIGYGEMFFNEFNYNALKRDSDVLMMDTLIERYKEEPIKYGTDGGDNIAVICHTSGTSNGTRKPLPYTDCMLNELTSSHPSGLSDVQISIVSEEKEECAANTKTTGKRLVLVPPFDFSSSANINGFVNVSFAAGNAIATTFFGFLHPKFVRCLKYYDVDMVFLSGFIIDNWFDIDDLPKDAFSSIKILGLGGSYISPAKNERYEAFLREHGFKGSIFRGYGMSELAGNMFMLPPNSKEDSLGFPSHEEDIRILDESDGQFHRLYDGAKEGIMYAKSKSMCLNVLDGELLFEYTEIDGENYICTNDVIHVNDDKSVSYVGRANKFFVNNEGIKFESSIVETQFSQHPAVDLCAIVPVLDKRIHDTVPVLYVVPNNKNGNGAEQIKNALTDIYIKGNKLKGTILPTQFIIVDKIPLSSSGKIDVYHITRSRLEGDAYNIIPVMKDEELVDINVKKSTQLNSYTGGNLPEGMGVDSSFNVFDIFMKKSDFMEKVRLQKKIVKSQKENLQSIKNIIPEFKLPNIDNDINGMPKVSDLPRALQGLVNVFTVLMSDQSMSDTDFEE